MQLIDLVPDLRPTILAARQVRDARNSLARFLPVQNVNAVSYRLGRSRRLDQTVPVRANDAPATPIRRPGLVEVRGDLPNVTPIYDSSEQDLINETILAQQLAGAAVDFQPFVDAGAAHVALTADNTFELMRGQLLSTGVVSLVAEDGDVHDVDFDIPSGQIITLVDEWNGAGAGNEFDDIEAAHEVFGNASGDSAGVILTSRRAKRHLLNALKVKFANQPIGQQGMDGYFADQGWPTIYTYDRTITNADGTRTRVFPEDAMVFLPSEDNPVGRTELGITQEAVQQTQRVQPNGATALTNGDVAGLTIVTLGQDNPVQRAVKGAARGLPVLSDTDSIVIVRGLFA